MHIVGENGQKVKEKEEKNQEFFSLHIQISKSCAKSAKFCAVAQRWDGDIKKLWLKMYCCRYQTVVFEYKDKLLLGWNVSKHDMVVSNRYLLLFLPCVVCWVGRGGCPSTMEDLPQTCHRLLHSPPPHWYTGRHASLIYRAGMPHCPHGCPLQPSVKAHTNEAWHTSGFSHNCLYT